MEIGPKSLMGLSLLTLVAVLAGVRLRETAPQRTVAEAAASEPESPIRQPATAPATEQLTPRARASSTGPAAQPLPTETELDSMSFEELLAWRRNLGVAFCGNCPHEPFDWSDPRLPPLLRRFDRLVVAKNHEEAKALASAPGTTPREGLARYAAAEDFVRKAVEDANKAKSPDEPRFLAVYKSLLADSDAYASRVIDEELTNAIRWKDLLSGEMAGKWARTVRVPGFSCRIENGVLTLTPPDKGSGMKGVASILDQPTDNLRHFVLDMEFTVEGKVTMFFHVNPPPNPPDGRQCEEFHLYADPDGFLVPGRKHTMSANYVASRLTIEFPGSEVPPWTDFASFAKRRKGGIAFVVPEGGRLVVTRMRIKELR